MYIGLINREYTRLSNRDNLIKAIMYYFLHNSFRVQCMVLRLSQMKPSVYRSYLTQKLEKQYGVLFGKNARTGNSINIQHYNGIVIGEKVIIGDNCTIYHQVTIGQKNGEYPIVGNNVTIYPGAKVIGKIVIGDNSIIAPNSVVINDVPSYSVVSGNPAKVIKIGKTNNE